MDRYHIALFIHLLALVIAAGATAVTKLAVGRRARAYTVGEALEWHDTLAAAAKLFPLCLVAFVLTGSYMLSTHAAGVWSSGFVVAGLAGVAWLFASGIFLAVKGSALRKVLARLAAQDPDHPAPKLVPPALVAALPPINSGVALGVAFDMVTKPQSVGVALAIVAFGGALFAASALRRPAPTRQQAAVAPAA